VNELTAPGAPVRWALPAYRYGFVTEPVEKIAEKLEALSTKAYTFSQPD
jgi:hypothetical protein